MAKKEIGKMQSKNLGGLANLIGPEDMPEGKQGKSQGDDLENKLLVKTFNIISKDFEFIRGYSLYRSYKDGERFTHKDVISEAIELLRRKRKDEYQQPGMDI
jgi:hypothetical protein